MSISSGARISFFGKLLNKLRLKLRAKLILIFAVLMCVPIILLALLAWFQINSLGSMLRHIAVTDTTTALNDSARENLERMTTDTARAIADFLHQRDQDILLLASLPPSEETFRIFSESRNGLLMTQGQWVISDDEMTWVQADPWVFTGEPNISTNPENDDVLHGSGFNYRPPEFFNHYRQLFPLFDEITFIDLEGNEVYKFISPNSRKIHYPMNPNLVNVADGSNTFIRAESFWEELSSLQPGEIFVSDVIGAYVGTKYIGVFTPGALRNISPTHPNYDLLQEIATLPREEFYEAARRQAFAGPENPIGQRFEGIVRWGTPVTDENNEITGFVTMALNHDHIMEFVNFITPKWERYSVLSNAIDGNYAFIWDYRCRNIVHPRHHSIVGFSPITGEPQVPWLEGTKMLKRDISTGSFLRDENGAAIPILDTGGNPQPATDTPFYAWSSASGLSWLESNSSWETHNLSKQVTGVYWWEWEPTSSLETFAAGSWGSFYEAHNEDRELLPQFGERVLRDAYGSPLRDGRGDYLLDYQSRLKTPAAALTQAGFVGLDGRFLNNAPQCTGWMDLTENGGSGSFFILWSGVYKPTTAGAIPYFTGQFSPERQDGSMRGFAFVTIGSGIEDFTAPIVQTEHRLDEVIAQSLQTSAIELFVITLGVFALMALAAVLLTSYITGNINNLIDGMSRFRAGERQYRLHSQLKDEFGELADSFDDMADSLVKSAISPLSIVNMDLDIVYMNDAALKLCGKSLEKVVGTPYHDSSIYPPNSAFDPIAALDGGREADILYLPDAGQYYIGVANYQFDQHGNKSGYMVVTNDVTEIQTTRLKAEQASIAKSTFLSNMSHEIRTPLNAIIGMTAIGTSSPAISKKDYSFGKINDASKHLLGIINDILDMSKIEANKFTLSAAEFSFERMISRAVDVINFRVEQKQQKFTADIDPAIPDALIGDDQRLAQVITNLLSNAVKFTPEHGCVEVSAKLHSEEDGICTLLICVSDTGIGISEEQQSRLFTPFEQAESNTSRKYGGTGLGLVICKNIVEMMDGKIWVNSRLGHGSVFSFTVRLGYSRSAGRETGTERSVEGGQGDGDTDEINFEGHHILLVEDVDINREIVLSLLEPTNLKIDCAENGLEAVEAFKANPLLYDMIFMDIQMPEMDGFTATRLIRASGLPRATEIPIVAMTANAFTEDIEKCLEAGMNNHIGKPIQLELLLDVLKSILHNQQ